MMPFNNIYFPKSVIPVLTLFNDLGFRITVSPDDLCFCLKMSQIYLLILYAYLFIIRMYTTEQNKRTILISTNIFQTKVSRSITF